MYGLIPSENFRQKKLRQRQRNKLVYWKKRLIKDKEEIARRKAANKIRAFSSMELEKLGDLLPFWRFTPPEAWRDPPINSEPVSALAAAHSRRSECTCGRSIEREI